MFTPKPQNFPTVLFKLTVYFLVSLNVTHNFLVSKMFVAFMVYPSGELPVGYRDVFLY